MPRFPLHDYTADAVADWLLEELDLATRTRGRATLAIAGGRSVGAVLESMARRIAPDTRAALSLLWVDERAVPRGHPERNDAAGLAAWDAGGPLPGRVLPMPVDLDPAQGIAIYARHLQDATGDGALDALLLGIGEDGHIASLFPGRPELEAPGPVLFVGDSPKPPPRRWTLALGVLSGARRRAVLALGAGKREARERAGETPSPEVPASLLPPNSGTRWYVDALA